MLTPKSDSRAYHRGEDGLAGIGDDNQVLRLNSAPRNAPVGAPMRFGA
jgi:hypothetical protein